ncbi:MAG: trypsin-like peptidase domain-containing protein, partial [Planctomycetota bacterium]|nr:trypsin-like peptidase domain-containing protein [Planctomycetota bacterium]
SRLLLSALWVVVNVSSTNISAQQPSAVDVARLLEKAIGDSVEQAERAVVSIARVKRERPAANKVNDLIEPRDPFDTSDDPGSLDFVPDDFASGVVVTVELANGRSAPMVLTNYHAVRGGPSTLNANSKSRLFVRFPTRHTIEATIIAADPRSDLAVLWIPADQLPGKPADLPAFRINNAPEIRKAQFVVTLGNPYAIARDGQASVSWGMISNITRRPAALGSPFDEDVRMRETIHHLGNLLHVDTRLNLGTSGGALIDVEGTLIGLTTSMAALEGYEKSAGYAIPLDEATIRIVRDLAQGHEVEYGFLGISPVNVQPRGIGGQPVAVKIQQVYADSPAHEYGIEIDDIVTAVNGQPIYDKSDLMRLVALIAPGGYARLTVWRGGKQLSAPVAVKLAKWPVSDSDGIIATNLQSYYRLRRGLAVDYATGRREYVPRPFRFHKAVAVRAIDPASPLAKQLEIGQFITHVENHAVSTPQQYHAELDKLTGRAVELTVSEGRQRRNITLPAN